MSGCEGALQIWMEFVVFGETDWLEGSRIELLEGSVVGFEPHAVHGIR